MRAPGHTCHFVDGHAWYAGSNHHSDCHKGIYEYLLPLRRDVVHSAVVCHKLRQEALNRNGLANS